MKKEIAIKASRILEELTQMEDIKEATEKGHSQWWMFSTPSTGIEMPGILRDEFKESVDKCLEILNKELEEL